MKMNEVKNKTKISMIPLVLMLALSTIFVAIPITIAQEPETLVTNPFLGVTPNPVGVNQAVLLHVGIFRQLTSAEMGWEGLTVTVTDPQGNEEILGPFKTDSTGGTGAVYTPTMVGTYTLQSNYPEQEITETKQAPRIALGTIMLASSSETVTLIVQEDPIPYYPGHSLPTEYWSRPIDAQLREWNKISGSWLDASSKNPQVVAGNEEAPDTAHILWAETQTLGGLAGGSVTGEMAFSHGDAYEGKWASRIIINGILIYTHRTNTLPLVYTAVNLRTGEELWAKTFLDNRTLAFGQTLAWSGYNHHAVYSYFYVTAGGSWHAFDPYTGDWEFTVANVPSGTNIYDDNGWIYVYNFDLTAGTGYIWSMQELILPDTTGPTRGSWPPAGSFYGARYQTYDAAETTEAGALTENAEGAYLLNFTIPTDLPGSIYAVGLDDRVFGMDMSQTEVTTWAFSLASGHEGDLLYTETWAAPAIWADGNLELEFNVVSLDDEVAVIWTKETRQYYGFSTETGEYLWGPAESEFYMNYYGWTAFGERPTLIYDGKLYSTGAGGIVYCYNVMTGDVLWTYEAADPFQEYLFANNWWQLMLFITDGKIYLSHLEHSAIEPMPRGGPFICLDANTGDEVWRADGLFRSTLWGGIAVIGDSVIATMDTYDTRVYAIGKGPSEITVEMDGSTTLGSQTTITGNVMDVSPGTTDTAIALRFPKGVPAVSDADMSEWMLYVYKNFERPAATGVTVKLEAIDPNGNYQSLGTTTTDSYGNFGFSFDPEIAGLYTIIATFDGSGSYYGSTSTTYITVNPAPTASTPIEPDTETPDTETPDTETPDTETPDTETPTAEAPLISTEVAIIAAVAVACVIGVAAFWALRKRQ
ncbi:MAG: hypothetical protein CW691_05615 [Candidatus Bathyarchaeum sp.]|nr:MAG: hypothetical protein CW691_05615 [Candidatus Bathyarchaeum sp.]